MKITSSLAAVVLLGLDRIQRATWRRSPNSGQRSSKRFSAPPASKFISDRSAIKPRVIAMSSAALDLFK